MIRFLIFRFRMGGEDPSLVPVAHHSSQQNLERGLDKETIIVGGHMRAAHVDKEGLRASQSFDETVWMS